MKKTNFIFIIFCTCNLVAFTQQIRQDYNNAYLERVRKLHEAYIETSRELWTESRNTKDCDDEELNNRINQGIKGFKNAVTDEDKERFMWFYIPRSSCPQVIDFFKDFIISDTSEFWRGQAVSFLGSAGAVNSIPFLWDYYQKYRPSTYISAQIAIALIMLEAWDYSEQILNENCYDPTIPFIFTVNSTMTNCATGYKILGNESSVKFFRHMNKTHGDGMSFILSLIDVGDKETALPILREYMKTSNPGRKVVLKWLELIGDAESIEIIQSALNDSDTELKKEAETTLKRIESR